MILSCSSTAFAGTSRNGISTVIHNEIVPNNILESGDAQVYDFTTAMIIDAFEEVTGKDAGTVLTDLEIKMALQNENTFKVKSAGDKNRIVYSEKNKKMDIYLDKATVKLIVGASSGSAAIAILTKVFASLSLPTMVANIAMFLVPYVVGEILGEKLSGDKGIVLHYKVVVVEKGEEWGYKYSFTGWEYQ